MAADKRGARERGAWIVFADESGLSLTPVVRRTWAPRGQTPVLRHRFNWKRVSMAGALAYRWDGKRARLYFQTCPDSYNDERLMEFVRHLRRHFQGERVILIWDGLPSHRSARMRQYLDQQQHWLEVERLPAYAPELNPVEGMWANLKGRDLADRCEERINDLADVAHRGARRIRSAQDLMFGFLRHAGLALSTD